MNLHPDQTSFDRAQSVGEDYFNASVDAIAARFGDKVAAKNLAAASSVALSMALDYQSSTERRNADIIAHGLERVAYQIERVADAIFGLTDIITD